MDLLREPPNVDGFVPLSEHQSSTPASFYSGPPVIHYYSDRCKVLILDGDLQHSRALAEFSQKSQAILTEPKSSINGNASEEDLENGGDPERFVEEVDIWVTSEKLLLYHQASSIGLAIPYPSIALHAVQSLPRPQPTEQQGVYMQVMSSLDEPSNEDLEPESISLTIIPAALGAQLAATENNPAENQPEQTPVMAMFTALSNCSNLHPDPTDPSEQQNYISESRLFQAGMLMLGVEGGGLPPAMPGSSGWITAENMHEHFDEQGNWIGDEEEEVTEEEALGPGAGSIRPRDETGAGEENGEGDESDRKWQRTS